MRRQAGAPTRKDLLPFCGRQLGNLNNETFYAIDWLHFLLTLRSYLGCMKARETLR